MPPISLKFCVEFSHHGWTSGNPEAPGKTIALARAADEAGVDSIWVSEDPDGWDAFAVLAAAGPKALELAGRRADGVLFNELASVDYLRGAIGRVKEAAAAAGRNPA